MSWADSRTLHFAPLPMVSAEYLTNQFLPFSRYLSTALQINIELVHYQSYQVLIEAFANDLIDLAYLGPLPYVMLKQKLPDVVPLAQFLNENGESTYTCSLVSFEKTIDLENISPEARIAMPQPYSTCAYLMTEKLLRQQGKSLEQIAYYYAGNHAEAALDVVRGKATLAGVKTEIGELYVPLGLKVFDQRVPLPGHLVVANPHTLSAEQIAQIKNKLLSLDPLHNPEEQLLIAGWGQDIRYGVTPVGSDEYRYIEQLLEEIRIPGVNK